MAEIKAARDTYTSISLELGKRFRDAIREQIARVGERPDMYPRIHGEIRRTITTDFPYSVFYKIERDDIVILRVIHHARDPEKWPR